MIEVRRILCPADFSEFSERALRHAIALASWYESEIKLIHVASEFVAHTAAPGFPAWASLKPDVRQRILTDLDAFAAPARAAGIRVAVDAGSGGVAAEILSAAQSLPADLIVM